LFWRASAGPAVKTPTMQNTAKANTSVTGFLCRPLDV